MSRTRTPVLATVACAALVMFVGFGAKNGCGSKEANTTAASPVQAVGTLLEQSDGSVSAQVVIVSTASNPHQFATAAKNVAMRMPDGTVVPLAGTSAGHYAATSQQNSAVVYKAGGKYQFKFELDDASEAKDAAGGSFIGVAEAPDDQVTFKLDPAPQFAGDTATVKWTPTKRFGMLTVKNETSGEVTYSSFDFDNPQFDGDKWARLTKGGTRALSVDAFPTAGDYTVSLCAVNKVSDFDTGLSADLGLLSGFLIGRCAAPVKVTVK